MRPVGGPKPGTWRHWISKKIQELCYGCEIDRLHELLESVWMDIQDVTDCERDRGDIVTRKSYLKGIFREERSLYITRRYETEELKNKLASAEAGDDEGCF